jgi:curved DNA-binding protein CbpA
MARLKPTTDPYRVLDILRGADPEQIKAAHRRLAKRYHPDGSTSDERRFLAVQEAYQLLSDPLRRREWDRRHAPGPIRPESRSRTRRQTGAESRPTTETTRPRKPRPTRPPRPPGQRTRTWTAERVPWWEDFRPGTASRDAEATPAQPEPPPIQPELSSVQPDEAANDFDVFNRSSGAAWSAAARQHFRRGTDDLPSRGMWRYRGTQVVTGAEARRVAAEEEEENPRR